MKLKLSSIKANIDRERKGDWVPYPQWAGVKFYVTSFTTPAFVTARDLLFQRLAQSYKGQSVPEDVSTPELARLVAEHIVHDWVGLADDAGDEIPFTRSLAIELLVNPEWRYLLQAVEWCANDLARVRAEFVADAVKN